MIASRKEMAQTTLGQKRYRAERVFILFLIKANLEGPISVNPIWHGEGGRDPTHLLLCRKSGVII